MSQMYPMYWMVLMVYFIMLFILMITYMLQFLMNPELFNKKKIKCKQI